MTRKTSTSEDTMMNSLGPNPNHDHTGCEVCGNADVLRDAVAGVGWMEGMEGMEGVEGVKRLGRGALLNLAECGRCHHRWTWRSVPAAAGRGTLRVAVRVPASLPAQDAANAA
jgi:hypothetical protein